MTAGAYDKLRAWAEKQGKALDVRKSMTINFTPEWSISVNVNKPVAFAAHGTGATIDEAAGAVIADLETVGVSLG